MSVQIKVGDYVVLENLPFAIKIDSEETLAEAIKIRNRGNGKMKVYREVTEETAEAASASEPSKVELKYRVGDQVVSKVFGALSTITEVKPSSAEPYYMVPQGVMATLTKPCWLDESIIDRLHIHRDGKCLRGESQ